MANWQAVNINTGTPEKPKYNAVGPTTELWVATLTTALASADTILGPTIPAGTYLTGVTIASDSLDSSTGLTFEAGYTGTLGAFISTGNTTAQAGGIATMNVAAGKGYTATTDTQVLVTITHVATTPVAGKMRIEVTYLANP